MPVPAIPEFEHFLSSIRLGPPPTQDGHRSFEVIRAKNAFDGARYSSTPAVTGSCATGAMTFDGAMARLAKVVKGSKHLANDAMLRLLLGMSSVGRPADIPAVVHFNSMLDKVSECDCSTFLVTSFKDRSPRLRIGRFLVGTVDVEKMKYRCKKIECDFFERYRTGIASVMELSKTQRK